MNLIYGLRYYLDQKTGEVWYTNALMKSWERTGITLPLISETLSSRITQASDSITSEVQRATTAEGEIYSQIRQTENEIVLKVDANGNVVKVELGADAETGTTDFMVSADNISLEGKTIDLTSDNIEISSTNFSVNSDGDVAARNLALVGGSIIIGEHFSVSPIGMVDASALTLTGGTININDKFIVDEDGNLSAEALDSFETTVANSQDTYDGGTYTIDFYGYGSPNNAKSYKPSVEYSGKYYLDQSSGKLWQCKYMTSMYVWTVVTTLTKNSTRITQAADSITQEVERAQGAENNLSSRIEQTATGISFNLSKNGEDTATLSMKYTRENGSTVILAAQSIKFDGLVEFTDLSGEGTTTINGANITTGTISADRLDVSGIFAKDVAATGTITGATIVGGNISATDTFKMKTWYNAVNYGYEPVLRTAYANVPGTNHYYLDIGNDSLMPRFIGNFVANGGIDIPVNGKGIFWETAQKTFRSAGTTGQNIAVYDDASSKFLIDIQSEGTYFKTTAYTSSGAVVTSDKDSKHDLSYLDIEKCNDFIQSLKPSSFKYNDGTSDRYHHGFFAQDVKESMGDEDWGVYIDDNPEEKGNKGLRYEELIADLVGTIQYQDKKMKSMKEEIATLKEQVAFLMSKVIGGE